MTPNTEESPERFVPSMQGQIKTEHFHRYALAGPFARNRDVLDLACGEGYGAAQLARSGARSVVGVDIAAPVIEAATKRYSQPNLRFCVGSCDAVPLLDASVDIVVSFETLEHHDQHEEMMREVKRVLRYGGSLLISSPNRVSYSEEAQHHNPHHVKELSLEEFVQLLRRHFRHVQVFGQKFAVASFVFPLERGNYQAWAGYTSSEDAFTHEVAPLEQPVYFVALCCDEPLAQGALAPSLYLDNEAIGLHAKHEREAQQYIARLHGHPLWKIASWLRQKLRPRG